MQVNVNIELPEDVSQALQKKWGDLSKRTLETLAIDGYRSGALSESQVRRMLRFQTRMEVHEFLKSAGVYFDYTEDDLKQDLETHHKLGIIPAR
jgi:predicted HTH domain antitoxin